MQWEKAHLASVGFRNRGFCAKIAKSRTRARGQGSARVDLQVTMETEGGPVRLSEFEEIRGCELVVEGGRRSPVLLEETAGSCSRRSSSLIKVREEKEKRESHLVNTRPRMFRRKKTGELLTIAPMRALSLPSSNSRQ